MVRAIVALVWKGKGNTTVGPSYQGRLFEWTGTGGALGGPGRMSVGGEVGEGVSESLTAQQEQFNLIQL